MTTLAPPITAVQSLFRHHARLRALEGDGLARLVSSFVDPSVHITISSAVETGSSRWVERIVAAHGRHVSAVLVDHWLYDAVSKAAELEHGEVVRWIIGYMQDRVPLGIAIAAAATIGDLALIQDMHEMHPDLDLSAALEAAASFGQVDVVRYLLGCGATPVSPGPTTPEWLLHCVYGRHLQILLMLDERKAVVWTPQVIDRSLEATRTTFPSSQPVFLQQWLLGIRNRVV
ncbi:hypothetical protein ATCC90586_008635 [Pythium insidiosum]|nr:hypothetical protein ATCC90586_008635 [Pythium insidiosum]